LIDRTGDLTPRFAAACFLLLVCSVAAPRAVAAGGSLTLTVREEATDAATIARCEIVRADAPSKQLPIRLTVPAGIGIVLDRKLVVELPEASYRFRVIRGPEYRIVQGNFTLERTSLDEKTILLPRMTDMLAAGWTSGDCCVAATAHSLPLRMAAEDLHVAASLGQLESRPIPRRGAEDPIEFDPVWIRSDAAHHGGIVVYGSHPPPSADLLPSEWIAAATDSETIKVAVENPFAWPLPVWLASGRIDGVFVLGDWLRLDRSITKVSDGRSPVGPVIENGTTIGRWAERIYWQMLEAGLRIAPLAGSGSDAGRTPVGYNRLYVAPQPTEPSSDPTPTRVGSPQQWWQAAWEGRSMATNGPMLQATLEGQMPGHVFTAATGEALQLQPELTLSVRDPVDYLEVIHNGVVHYSAALHEYAAAGGRIPPLHVKQSGWIVIRVVTLHEDHFRAAMTAPWHIDFDNQRRATVAGIEFFQDWLHEYEQRLKRQPANELSRHAPFIRQARAYWTRAAENAKRTATSIGREPR
jgi:hypothetical protein